MVHYKLIAPGILPYFFSICRKNIIYQQYSYINTYREQHNKKYDVIKALRNSFEERLMEIREKKDDEEKKIKVKNEKEKFVCKNAKSGTLVHDDIVFTAMRFEILQKFSHNIYFISVECCIVSLNADKIFLSCIQLLVTLRFHEK